ncbi:MAG TPA: amidohydrolase family protein, partial [Symbiobacteriaceae bacterium]|nr:amidohydrolase family protein [Symbiobacteriaceae bacterium]
SIVAHCVHVDEADMDLLASSGATVTHQPHSNMGNAVGRAPVLSMQERGVRTALGTDGYTWDLLETMRTAAVLHAHATGAPGAGVGEFGRMLLAGNATLASAIFGHPVGAIAPGAAADLVLWDYHPPTPFTPGNLPWHMQFGMAAPLVHTVWVGGRCALRDRQVPGIDEAALAAEAHALALGVWRRF